MPNPKTPKLMPFWILDNDLNVTLLPSVGMARLDGQRFVSLDELAADLLDYLRSNAPASCRSVRNVCVTSPILSFNRLLKTNSDKLKRSF